MDDWLLYAQDAISVADGRGTAIGRFFTTSGVLVATVVQEGMLRTSEVAS
jgi:acyl-CoA thioesterase-2